MDTLQKTATRIRDTKEISMFQKDENVFRVTTNTCFNFIKLYVIAELKCKKIREPKKGLNKFLEFPFITKY